VKRNPRRTKVVASENGTAGGLFSAGRPHSHQAQICGSMMIMTTILLLTISNIFMTFAWYGHLKYRQAPLFKVILISWLIAFAEYCFQVPANRIGSYQFSPVQLKTIQEVITLTVFSVFSVFYLGDRIKWNYLAGFALIVLAVFVIFKKW
jgi:uncharacterized protein (DUF486 family)